MEKFIIICIIMSFYGIWRFWAIYHKEKTINIVKIIKYSIPIIAFASLLIIFPSLMDGVNLIVWIGIIVFLLFSYITILYFFKVRKTENYNILIRIRKSFRYTFLVFTTLIWVSVLCGTLSNVYYKIAISLIYFPVLVILYKFLTWLVGLRDFYDESHVENMEYFILYLRTFNDDSYNTDESKRIISLFYNFFCPFAVGIPNDFLPPKIGAPRLYLGKNWKNQVLNLMDKAQIILLRIGKTDHFLWEYYNVIEKEYLSKTIFWIKDVDCLSEFIEKTKTYKEKDKKNSEENERKNDSFPNDMLRNRNLRVWQTIPFDNNAEYLACHHNGRWIILDKSCNQRFAEDFINNHHQIVDNCMNYLYGYNHIFKHLIKVHYDNNLMNGIPKWDWFAFLFPEFFIITHRIDKVSGIVKFLIIDAILINGGIFALRGSTIVCVVVLSVLALFRLAIMFLMGHNARTVEWLSEKWESMSYFNKTYQSSNYRLLLLAASVLGGMLLLMLL